MWFEHLFDRQRSDSHLLDQVENIDLSVELLSCLFKKLVSRCFLSSAARSPQTVPVAKLFPRVLKPSLAVNGVLKSALVWSEAQHLAI